VSHRPTGIQVRLERWRSSKTIGTPEGARVMPKPRPNPDQGAASNASLAANDRERDAKAITDLVEQDGVTDAWLVSAPASRLPDVVMASRMGGSLRRARLFEIRGNAPLAREEQRAGWGYFSRATTVSLPESSPRRCSRHCHIRSLGDENPSTAAARGSLRSTRYPSSALLGGPQSQDRPGCPRKRRDEAIPGNLDTLERLRPDAVGFVFGVGRIQIGVV
jgi:hypothetical protein